METKKIIMGVISIAVAIIVLMSMIPIFTDAGASEDTFTNEGYARYSSIESSSEDEITITWDHTDPKNVTVGTEKVSLSQFNTWTSMVFGQDWTIRFTTSAQNNATSIQYLGPTSADYLAFSDTGTTDMTVTLDSGTFTITNGTTTKTATYTTAYYPENAGSMTMKKSDEVAYLKPDSSIVVANGITVVSGTGVGVYFDGTIEDGYEVSLYNRNVDTTTVSNVVSNYEEMSSYIDLVKLTTITLDMTPDGGTPTHATYSYFLVPYEVTAERSAHASPVEATLIGLIPLLMMVGIMLTAVGLFIAKYRKN